MIASISYTEVSSAPSQCRALPEEEHAPAVAYAGWLDVRYSTGDFDYNKKVCLQWQNDLGEERKALRYVLCNLGVSTATTRATFARWFRRRAR